MLLVNCRLSFSLVYKESVEDGYENFVVIFHVSPHVLEW